MAARKKPFRKLRQRIRQLKSFAARFPYRPDDVVIVSYPKSGSTWLRFILASLVGESAAADAGGEVDFARMHVLVPEIARTAVEAGIDFDTLPAPRLMRTHSAYAPAASNVVYLLRDGRDVLISYYHHFRKFDGFEGGFSDFLRSDKRRTEWADHVQGWIFDNPLAKPFCLIRYEDMLRDPFAEVKKIAQFSGLKNSDEHIRRATEQASFENMRRVEEVKGMPYYKPKNTEMRFIRQGKSGGWKDVFTEEDKAFFKQHFGAALIKCGYESSHLW
ncbi:MAG TPA: sulfotransferase domain-containing protein [Candidatus Limnocylindria bacterium]|nr:sulfotransferase domain-containing protein [Candidatus Limnocylindria bacterium]